MGTIFKQPNSSPVAPSKFYSRRIHHLTCKFHVKSHARNRNSRDISFQVIFNMVFKSKVVNFSRIAYHVQYCAKRIQTNFAETHLLFTQLLPIFWAKLFDCSVSRFEEISLCHAKIHPQPRKFTHLQTIFQSDVNSRTKILDPETKFLSVATNDEIHGDQDINLKLHCCQFALSLILQ